jgi:hypothetical protein
MLQSGFQNTLLVIFCYIIFTKSMFTLCVPFRFIGNHVYNLCAEKKVASNSLSN